MSLPTNMRAWTYRTKGLPSITVQLESDIKTPQPVDLGPDDVLVEIHYVAFNGGVTSGIQGLRPRPLAFFLRQRDRVAITEFEFAGRLIAAGGNVLSTTNHDSSRKDLKIGELVIGTVNPFKALRDGSGALAEYAITSAQFVVPYQLPGGEQSKLSLAEWAGLGGVGCTAIQAVERAGLKPGDKVLINGGSGGAGVMMVQVARSVIGPQGRLVATCSAANVELVKSLGADEVIDYRQHSPLHAYLAESEHAGSPFDAIIDNVGIQELFTHSPSYLAPGKKFIAIGAMNAELSLKGAFQLGYLMLWNQFCPVIFGGVPRKFQFYSAKPDLPSLELLRKMSQEGSLRQIIDSIWEFEDVPRVSLYIFIFRTEADHYKGISSNGK
jgi:NADPH:quinone reductase-like Zn-dependent oxidoreductase